MPTKYYARTPYNAHQNKALQTPKTKKNIYIYNKKKIYQNAERRNEEKE